MASSQRTDEVDVSMQFSKWNPFRHHKKATSKSHDKNRKDLDASKPAAMEKPLEIRKWYEQHSEYSKLFEYNMTQRRRGRALIINNKTFTYPGGTARDGTDCDRDSLTCTLKYLGFHDEDIMVQNDATVAEMKNLMSAMAQQDYTDYGCSFVVILSHGDDDQVDGKDGPTQIEDLIRPFKSSTSLAGKPKIFIIQSCRGSSYDDGMLVYDETDSPCRRRVVRKISLESDFLIAYSTIPGYYSWRSVHTGSWFIQSFCDVMDFSGRKLEFQQCLARVCYIVSTHYQSVTGVKASDGKKQSPLIHSTLTKDLNFN